MLYTKIVCTLGPACNTPEGLQKLIAAGMNVARLNLSHGTLEQHRDTIRSLKAINEKLRSKGGLPTCVGIMLDTKGAEVRTGVVEKPLTIAIGEEVVFSPHPCPDEKRQVIIVNHQYFGKDAKDAEQIVLDNGKMMFELVKVNKDGSTVARSLDAGTIGSRRHVNLPGANLTMPSITDKDWEDIAMGAEEGVDFYALSFIREGKEVEEVRKFLKKKKSNAMLITKIETRQAAGRMEEIIEASDGIMVARGDLGSEVPFETIPAIQDKLVSLTREAGKPVIVATHMLESMIENPTPTRAEVTDIAHAVTIGTDATMLSGETAGGKYPFASLETMARVIRATENHVAGFQRRLVMPVDTIREAQADAAVSLALSSKAAAIVVMTKSGKGAREISRYRPHVPLIACTPTADMQRELQLCYGVVPLLVDFADDPEQTVEDGLAMMRERKLIKRGDTLVLVSDARTHDEKQVSTIQVRQVP